jgi:hypothetical protein
MGHAGELIRQIIRTHNLHKIYPGHEDSAFGDLFQTAWIQLEKTLYKYKAQPYCALCYCGSIVLQTPDTMETVLSNNNAVVTIDGLKSKICNLKVGMSATIRVADKIVVEVCANTDASGVNKIIKINAPKKPNLSVIYTPAVNEYGIISPEEILKRKIKCPTCAKVPPQLVYRGTSKIFNLWSQIARTVILAYIKKESRDYKNSDSYRTFLDDKKVQEVDKFERFITEAKEMCKYNPTHITIIDSLSQIVKTDDKPYEGLIGKLAKLSGQSRTQVSNFLRTIRLYSFEFTDSPVNVRENNIDDKKYQVDFEPIDE